MEDKKREPRERQERHKPEPDRKQIRRELGWDLIEAEIAEREKRARER